MSYSITGLIERWREGDLTALDRLTRALYAELKQLAARHLRREGALTLTPTALVSETYLCLLDGPPSFDNRVHFFAVAARQMRHILVDFARARGAQKRGAGQRPVTLDEDTMASQDPTDILAIDDALTALAAIDERKARVIELHYFGGLTLHEVASALDIHHNTVLRDLRFAEAWLNRHLSA